MKVRELIDILTELDMDDSNVYVTLADREYSFLNIDVTYDEDEDMGTDVYISGNDN